MSRHLPAILGVIVVLATGIGIFAVIGRKDDLTEIRRALSTHVTEKIANSPAKHKPGIDFVVSAVQVVTKSETVVIAKATVTFPLRQQIVETYHELSKSNDAWTVTKAMHEDFGRMSAPDAWKDALMRRLGNEFAERWNKVVSWRETLPFEFAIGDEAGTLRSHIGTKPFTLEMIKDDKGAELLLVKQVDPKLIEHGGQIEPGQMLATYREAWKYEGGKWVQDGRGQIFERPK